jgi:hypothetical protein
MVGNAVGAAKGLAAAKRKNKRPASGMPASGIPAGGGGDHPARAYAAENQPAVPATGEAKVVGRMSAQMLREAAQELAAAVLTGLAEDMVLPSGHPMRAAAMRELLDRGYGKAVQAMTHEVGPTMTPEERDARIAFLEAKQKAREAIAAPKDHGK